MTDDEKASAERARRLREEIGRRAGDKPPGPPRTPHDFVEERMRKLAKESKEEREDNPDEPPR